MPLLTLFPESTVTINHEIFGIKHPIQFSVRSPVACDISIHDSLVDDKKLLTTMGRQLVITIEY